MRVWIVNEGRYYTDDSNIHSVHVTRKSVKLQARADGFKWSKKDNMFYNDEKQLYRKLKSEEVIEIKK